MHVTALLDYDNASHFNQFIINIINSVGNVSVTSFILISGYFGIKFKWKKYIELIVTTTVYCVLVAAFRYGDNPVELVKAFLTLPCYNLWFIACYLIIMPLAPYINKLVVSLSKSEFQRLVLILVVFFSVIPTFFVSGAINNVVLRMGGKNLTFMIAIYVIGRYVRIYNDRNYNRWVLWGGHLACVLCVYLLNMIGSYFFHKRCVIFGFDCSPISLFSALCVFYLFKSWSFKSNIVNWFSSSVFAFYILSYIFYYFDKHFVHLGSYSTDNRFILYLLILVLTSWIFTLFIDKSLGKGIKWLVNKYYDYFSIVLEKK